MHYSISQRVWTGPFAVTGTGEDVMRTAVAIDGQGRAWIFYSAQRSGNFDLYARNALADGTLSPEIRLTSDPGTDLFPVAATDASNRVWVAWQGFRNNNLEVLAAAQTGDTFTNERIVSTSSGGSGAGTSSAVSSASRSWSSSTSKPVSVETTTRAISSVLTITSISMKPSSDRGTRSSPPRRAFSCRHAHAA